MPRLLILGDLWASCKSDRGLGSELEDGCLIQEPISEQGCAYLVKRSNKPMEISVWHWPTTIVAKSELRTGNAEATEASLMQIASLTIGPRSFVRSLLS